MDKVMEDDSVKESLLSSHLECSKRLKNDWERICKKFMNIKDDGPEFLMKDIEEYYNSDNEDENEAVEITRVHRVVLNDCSKYPVDILLQNIPQIDVSTQNCKTVIKGKLVTTKRTSFQVSVNDDSDDDIDGNDYILNDVQPPTETVIIQSKRHNRKHHQHKHHRKHRHHKRHHSYRHHHASPRIQQPWMTPMTCLPMAPMAYPFLLPTYTPYLPPPLYTPHMTHPHTCCHTHH
ncbi:uncharacterized protein [Dysidea avara]|uniref:uncharacterized protein n=1 Tax=Dysidea avara TaxID=196820 RepID=UPI0033290942